MAEAVRHRPLTSEVQVESQISPYEVCGGQNGTRVGFSANTSVFSLFVIMPPMHHTYIHLHVSLTTKTSWRSLGTI
jgi:hypothetical protein